MKTLDNRIAVVTGAGSGIGKAICLELARQGVGIAAVDIDQASLDEVQQAVVSLGRKCSTHVVDVASREQMEALPKEVHPGISAQNLVEARMLALTYYIQSLQEKEDVPERCGGPTDPAPGSIQSDQRRAPPGIERDARRTSACPFRRTGGAPWMIGTPPA